MAETSHIPSLTPIRGLAALRVMTMHFTAYLLPALGLAMKDASPVFSRAYLGVDYFFVLSGFILAHVYGPRFAEGFNNVSLRKFWWARFSRIYPLHLLTLLTLVAWQLGSTLLYAWIHGAPLPQEEFQVNMTRSSIVSNLFLAQIFLDGQNTSWNFPAWSLSAEWASYLILPFLFRPYFKIPRAAIPLGVAACGLGLWLIERSFYGHLDVAGWPGFARCLIDQFMGVLLYRLYQKKLWERAMVRDRTTLALAGVIVGLMSWRALPDAVIVPFVSLMVWALAANRGTVHRALNCRGMRVLGDLSYGIYIWHGVVLLMLYRLGTLMTRGEPWRDVSAAVALMTLALSLVVVTGLARLSLHWVEEPARRWLRGGRPAEIVKKLIRRAPASETGV